MRRRAIIASGLLFTYALGGAALAYVYFRWVKHNPEAAIPAAIITLVTGSLLAVIAGVATFFGPR